MVAYSHCHHSAASRIAYRINPGLGYCAIYLYAILRRVEIQHERVYF